MKTFKALVLLLVALWFVGAEAAQFSSQFLQFELPPGWSCDLVGSDWVCQSKDAARRKEAIAIFVGKLRGPQDDMANYQSHLKKVKVIAGSNVVSDPRYTKVVEVDKHRWVDSLHLSSEVPGFYTRYMATVRKDIGVGVTFSVAKDHYLAYKSMFDRMIRSMKVFRGIGFGPVKKPILAGGGKKNEDLISIPTMDPDIGTDRPNRTTGVLSGSMWKWGLLVIFLIAFLYRMFQMVKK